MVSLANFGAGATIIIGTLAIYFLEEKQKKSKHSKPFTYAAQRRQVSNTIQTSSSRPAGLKRFRREDEQNKQKSLDSGNFERPIRRVEIDREEPLEEWIAQPDGGFKKHRPIP